MSRQKKETRYEVLRQDPDYIKDWQEWQDIEDEVQWEVKKRALQEKFGVEELPNPLYDPQRRAKKKEWPEQRTAKAQYSLIEKFYRARVEGIKEEDPPEVKQNFANYQEYRKQREKWDIPLTPEQLSTLDDLASKDFDQHQDKLAEIIETWGKQHRELALEIFQPGVNKNISTLIPGFKIEKRRWLAMMGFVPQKALEKPILPQYPFETYFLTVNVFAKLYGLSPDVVDAIFSRISRVYQRAKMGENLSEETRAPSEEKSRGQTETEWQTQSDRMEARAIENAEQKDSEGDGYRGKLSQAEILSEQYVKYDEAMATISRQVARETMNLEAYLHGCLKNAYKRASHGGRKPGSRMSGIPAEEIKETAGPQESNLSPARIFDSQDAQKRLAEWRRNFRAAASFSERQKDILMMKETGFPLKEIAKQKRVSVDTVKRELDRLRSDPAFQDLLKQYGDISDDVGELAPYRSPQRKRRENNPRICPKCKLGLPKGDTNEECPTCHSPLPRVPIK
jgi:DNA-directed RNA polymerase specialized sigma24 family protein